MHKRAFIDLETYSTVPIAAGTYRYAERAEIMLTSWALDDGPVGVWDRTRGGPMPGPLREALENETVEIYAHNAGFDRVLMLLCGEPVERVAAAQIERWRCTMARRLAHGLQGALPGKLDDGRALIRRFCMPRKDGGRNTAETHPEEWARFVAYAARDIDAMREQAATLPEWNYRGTELALWCLDATINSRGVAVDVAFAEAAIETVEHEQKRLAQRTHELTGGAVDTALRRDLLLSHILLAYGVSLPDMRADTIERALSDGELPEPLRELLAVRLAASTASVAKYKAALRCVSADGRLRGTMRYAGAPRTRRWSGKLFQPQNLKRQTLLPAEVEAAVDATKAGCADLLYNDVNDTLSECVRGCLVAAPGRKLVVGDLANIEGRVAAWLAGEQWKLDAFAAYDRGAGPDLYRVAYARAFNVAPESVTAPQRQIGKVMELMMQYEGGVGAFVTGAAAYGIDLDEMAEAAWPTIPERVREEAAGFLAWAKRQKRPTFGLADRTFAACDALKRLWRTAHPGMVALWASLNDAALAAVLKPGATFHAGPRLKTQRDGAWLRVRLPSGNYLCYPQPAVEDGALTYAGPHRFTRKWGRVATRGAQMFENACQSVARDVMAAAMHPIEAAGYPIVLTVHDEVVTEPADSSEYTADRLSALLAAGAPWTAGLPLAAKAAQMYRYGKH